MITKKQSETEMNGVQIRIEHDKIVTIKILHQSDDDQWQVAKLKDNTGVSKRNGCGLMAAPNKEHEDQGS